MIEEAKQEKLIEQTVSKVPQSALEDLPQTDKKASILSTVMHKSKTAANIVINKLKTKLPVNTPTGCNSNTCIRINNVSKINKSIIT
ncbi:MAG: hypothetical protein ACLSA2_01975 [Candidatus Gastranaerophilaceae bacterium]